MNVYSLPPYFMGAQFVIILLSNKLDKVDGVW